MMKKVNLLFLFFAFISFEIYSQGLKLEPNKYKAYETYTTNVSIDQMPSSVSLKKYCPKPLKQQESKSVGWAIAYAALSTQNNIMMDETNYMHKWARAFDPNFLYSFIKQKEGNWCQNETSLTGALNVIEQYGCKPRVWSPWLTCNENKPFNELTLSVASQYKIEGWKALREDEIVNETKKALNNKLPVIIGIPLTESFINGSSIINGGWIPLTNEKIVGGQAMCVIGYDNKKNGGSFELMNSYGESFGDKGFIWITYKDFENFVEEAYVMKTINYEKGNISFGDCLNSYSRYKFENGDVYEGIVKDSAIDIYGSMFYSNGSIYLGGWNKGRKNGSGIFYDDSIQKIFKIYFENDVLIDQTEKSFGFANSEAKIENLTELIKLFPINEISMSDFETAQSVLAKYDNQDIALAINLPSKNNLIEIRKKYSHCKEAGKKGICPHDYKKNFNESIKSFNNKDYHRALTLINKSLNNAELFGEDLNKIYYQKAQILAAKKLYAEAIEEMYKISNDTFEFYNYNLAVYQSKVENYKNAISLFKIFLKNTNKLKSETNEGLGYCYLKQNKLNEALNAFRTSNEIKYNIDASIGLINTLMQLDEREKAMEELILIQKKYPRNLELKTYLVNCNMNDGKTKGLSKNIRAIKRSKSAEALLTIGNYNFKHKKNYKEAESNYKKSKLKDKAAIGLTEVNFIQKSEYSGGYLSNPMLNEISGIDNYNKGNYILALNNLISATEFKNGYRLSYDALLCLGSLYLEKDQINKAQETFETAIKRSNNNAYAHAGLGFCLSKAPFFITDYKLYTKANVHFNNALKVEPNNSIFLFNAGATEFLMKNYPIAKQNLTQAARIDSLNPLLLNALALTYSKINEYDNAIKYIRKACEIDPKSYVFEINSGFIITEQISQLIDKNSKFNVNAAITNLNKYYDKAFILGAIPWVISINRGYGYFKANRKDSAIIFYNQINSEDSLIIAVKANNTAVVNALSNKSELALKDFNKAIEFDKKEKVSFFIKKNKNIILRENYNFAINKNKEFTSINYFDIPLSSCKPKFTGNLNVPETQINLNIPNEVKVGDKYDFDCSEHSKYYLVFHNLKGERPKKVKRKKGVDGCPTPNK
jgi:tetratricopeptide (TPR) repeat protein